MIVKKLDRHDIEDINDAGRPGDSEEDGAGEPEEDMHRDAAELMAMYEESFKPVEPGRIVEGEVVGIARDKVLLDIGYKYEGEVPVSEFADMDGGADLHVGDRVEVYFVGRDEEGYPLLSREEVRTERLLEELGQMHESGQTVRGRIISQVKGGFFVDIGIRAFLPASQLDVKPAKNPEEWIGTEDEFKILQFDRAERNVVVSRRVLIEAERRRQQEAALQRLHVGDVVEGTITNITDYGLFVELGGITGLVHVSNLSWTPVRQHPSKMYSVGDRVSVKILEIAEESRKVSLGIKQLTPNPWDTLEQEYPRGAVIEGKIKKVTEFGIFVGIVEGINGLVHVSDMSWTHTVRPSDHYRKGQTVRAMILDIDRESQRVNLGIKQLEPNPWEELPRKYPPGTEISGKIVNIADFGVFVEIEEGIQGLVHVSELPAGHGEQPQEQFQVGQEVSARVIEVLPEEKKVRLSMKGEKADKPKSKSAAQKRGKAKTGATASRQDAQPQETALGRLLKEKIQDRDEAGTDTDTE